MTTALAYRHGGCRERRLLRVLGVAAPDGKFTMLKEDARTAVLLAAFLTNTLTDGQ